MDLPPFPNSKQKSTGFENKWERVFVWGDGAAGEHLMVESKGLRLLIGAPSIGANDGVLDEGLGIVDGREKAVGIAEIRGSSREMDNAAVEEEGVVVEREIGTEGEGLEELSRDLL
ncbi:hypothetical protein ACLOJK_029115 [Asimina triloba]